MNSTLLNCLNGDKLATCLTSDELAAPLAESESSQLASLMSGLCGQPVYPRSITAARHSLYFLGRKGPDKLLGIISEYSASPGGFQGSSQTINVDGRYLTVTLCETTP